MSIASSRNACHATFGSFSNSIRSLQIITLVNLGRATELEGHSALHHSQLSIGCRGTALGLEGFDELILLVGLLELHVLLHVGIALYIFGLFHFLLFELFIQLAI